LLNQTQADNTDLQNLVNAYIDNLNLDKSTVWIDNITITQPANSYTEVQTLPVPYAGFVSVNVTSSTTNSTYVETIWSTWGINYDNNITVGTKGTANFPVLSNNWEPIPNIVNDTLYSLTFDLPGHNITIPLTRSWNSSVAWNWSNATTTIIAPWINETVTVYPGSGAMTLLTILVPEIRIGNTNTVGNATETVTITYYYWPLFPNHALQKALVKLKEKTEKKDTIFLAKTMSEIEKAPSSVPTGTDKRNQTRLRLRNLGRRQIQHTRGKKRRQTPRCQGCLHYSALWAKIFD